MEMTRIEMANVEAADDQVTVVGSELNDLQLALVGGGIADPVAY